MQTILLSLESWRMNSVTNLFRKKDEEKLKLLSRTPNDFLLNPFAKLIFLLSKKLEN